MRRIYILFAGILLTFSLAAQEFTIEYNIGYGAYKMEGLSNWLENSSSFIPLKKMKVTDDFPGYITHQMNLGMEWFNLHQAGISLTYMNTVWNKAVSDYSGSVDFRMRVKGVRLAPFYRFVLPDFKEKKVRPYLQLTAGFVFNNGKIEGITISNNVRDIESESLDGLNFFIEPALGCKIRLHKMFALNVNAGYQFDLTKSFKFEGQKAATHPDWSGLRVQGGLIYYVSLK